MKKVILFSLLLLLGLVTSQVLPDILGPVYKNVGDIVRYLTMIGLSYIMIRVGYEFDLDKTNLRQYGWDYFVAFTAASFPWIFVTLYFIFVILPPGFWSNWSAWQETLLAGRFAAPTSAGVLFSMLAAAGLGTTWLYRKARILAIFDDLDTVLLMIPLKMLMIGLAWQLGLIVLVMAVLLSAAYVFMHKIHIPITWPWTLGYATVIMIVSEVIYKGSTFIDESVPVHIEVLLPAFVLGCIIAYPGKDETQTIHHSEIETPVEKRVSTIIAASFMILVGMSMPVILSEDINTQGALMTEPYEPSMRAGGQPRAEAEALRIGQPLEIGRITASQEPIPWTAIVIHVILVTVISNIGKMFPAFCYTQKAHWRERLALSIGMWPRGEVGAGVLVISLSYGIGGPVVTIAMLSLALNLLLTGVFIYFVKKITWFLPSYQQISTA